MKKILLRRQGFTLIELLIVIVIIGILAVGFAPSLLNAPKKARDGVRKGQIAGIKQAVDTYALDKNSVYPIGDKVCINEVKDDIGTANVLAPYFQGGELPKDPDGKSCFYYKNDSTKDKSYYSIYTKLEVKDSGNVADPANDLKYDFKEVKGDYFAVTQKY